MTSAASWVLLHGTPLTPRVWEQVADSLVADRAVHCPSVALPAGVADRQRRAAAQLLDDIAGPLDVVGHSFGGQVALEVALAAPARVRSLTVLCSRDTPFPGFEGPAAALRAGALDAVTAMARWFRPDEIVADGPVVRYARACLDEVDLHAWADDLEAIAGYDRCDDMFALTMPTLLVAAEHDQVSSPEVMNAMSGRIPDARFELVPGAAHMSIFTRPTQLAALLDRAAERDQPSG